MYAPSDDLEARAIAQFDNLLRKGELFWEPAEEIKCEQQPFDVFFRISTATSSKPYNPDSTTRAPGFLDDDPDFTLVPHVSPNHKLILNKFCWVRPQLILHTRDFQSQRELLTAADFEASVDVLGRLGGKYMVIFNGGKEAGSSVAHKHLQVFGRPGWRTGIDGEGNAALPFKHRLVRLNPDANLDAQKLHESYQQMCNELEITPGSPHNLLLLHEWMLVIPRRCGVVQGETEDAPLQAGANGMIGMLWIKSEAQLENWKRYGPMNVLKAFGVPKEE